MAHIHLKNVEFSYQYHRSLGLGFFSKPQFREFKHALKGITLDIKEGDRVALLGKNGAGKSTLLKVLSGVLPVNQGEISIDGRVYSFFGRNVGINPFLSGYDNLYIRALFHGLPPAAIAQKLREIAEFTELGDDLNRPVSTYSAGMKARLTFSMLMFVDAEIMLVDEGLGAGDKFFIEKARAYVDYLLDKSKILVFASHSEHLLKRFCNKALLLENGCIKEFGNFETVLKKY